MRALAAAFLALFAAMAAPAWPQAPAAPITVAIKAADGSAVGTATLTDAPNGVLMRLEVKGLPPGWHGLHVHEKADCAAPDFTSAGGHVHDKAEVVHGLLNPDATEAGDLPNLYVAADGSARVELFSSYLSLKGTSGRPALLDTDGSALVIHANADDHMAQPIGGAGARVACGAIK
jgi:Cu-Zn family superoxide dismutase